MNAKLILFVISTGLCLLQVLAAVPWLMLIDTRAVRSFFQRPSNWAKLLGGVVVAGIGLGIFIDVVEDPLQLLLWGRLYGAVLHLQLAVDILVAVFPVLMLIWPQGAAVALAAFREGVRQPMFWLIILFGAGLLLFSPFLPYFTFGEDMKMVRQIGYDTIMLAGVLFGVLASSMSISEEIEGRTAITVMSKPISRRQFLLGKFVGTLLAALLMTGLLGWLFNGVTWFKLWFDRETISDPFWVEAVRRDLSIALGGPVVHFLVGSGIWFHEVVWETMPGLVFGFCQVMVLLAISVGLATRLPMVVNLVTCLLVFFLGHLTHVLVRVSEQRYALVNFMAKVFENVLPGLEYFDLSRLLVRDLPPDPGKFSLYMASVVAYAVLYSVIALLFGLILFEDRDLA
jgi:hypothetical protein